LLRHYVPRNDRIKGREKTGKNRVIRGRRVGTLRQAQGERDKKE
jgi:hypothetical protein